MFKAMRKPQRSLRDLLTHITLSVSPALNGKNVFHRFKRYHVNLPRATCGVILCRKSCLVLHPGMPILLRPSRLCCNPGGWVCLLLSFLAFNFVLLMGSKSYHLGIAFILYLCGPWAQSRPCLLVLMGSALQSTQERAPHHA